MTDNVYEPCVEYTIWMDDSLLPRTLMKGTRGMKLAGELFLSKAPVESDEVYKRRLESSTLFNAYKKTCNFLAGQVFQTDIMFEDEVAEEEKSYANNIDGKGNSINLFAKRLFINGLGKGVTHILVDLPNTGGANITVEDEQKSGVRPYFRELRVEDLIGYRFDENGKLDQIRIQETKTKLKGKYGQEEVPCIRVYNQDGTWELHEKNEGGAFVMKESGTLSYKGIPLASFIPGDEINIVSGHSPLMDLAELNLYHWRSSSDQTNILHVGRVPLLFGRGVDLSQMVASSSAMITTEEEHSDMKYVEITGAAISAGREDIKACEASMAIYGLQQLVPRTGSQTATEKSITSAESQSSLHTWAIEFESCLDNAFSIAAKFMGRDYTQGSITVNKEFSLGAASAEELAIILKAHEQGLLSDVAAFNELRRRSVIDEGTSWEDILEEKKIDEQSKKPVSNLVGSLFGDDEGVVEGAK